MKAFLSWFPTTQSQRLEVLEGRCHWIQKYAYEVSRDHDFRLCVIPKAVYLDKCSALMKYLIIALIVNSKHWPPTGWNSKVPMTSMRWYCKLEWDFDAEKTAEVTWFQASNGFENPWMKYKTKSWILSWTNIQWQVCTNRRWHPFKIFMINDEGLRGRSFHIGKTIQAVKLHSLENVGLA